MKTDWISFSSSNLLYFILCSWKNELKVGTNSKITSSHNDKNLFHEFICAINFVDSFIWSSDISAFLVETNDVIAHLQHFHALNEPHLLVGAFLGKHVSLAPDSLFLSIYENICN